MKKKTVKSFNEILGVLDSYLPDPNRAIKAIQDDIYREGQSIIRSVKSNHDWKDRSGELTRSHQAVKRGRIEVVLRATAKHAKHLYYGTVRHKVPLFGNRKVMIWVSGVWAGKERTGRTSGARSTPKNAKELRWLEKAWQGRRKNVIKSVLNTLNSMTGVK